MFQLIKMDMRSVSILFGTLLVVLSSISSTYGRAIDDIDNSIQPRSETFFDKRDWVLVSRPPPSTISQVFGQPVEITCEIMGSPLPSVQWVQGEGPINEDEIMDIETNAISESSPNAIVRVRSVLVLDHPITSDRIYTCVGRNGGNFAYASTIVHSDHKPSELTELIAQHKQLRSSRKPRIIYSYSQYIDIVESTIVLPCKAVGRPRPEVYWVNNEGVVIGNEPRFKVLPNGNLLIKDLKWEDMGLYKCIAQNSLGKDSIETFVYPASKE